MEDLKDQLVALHKAVKLYRQGMSVGQAAKECGLPFPTLYRHLWKRYIGNKEMQDLNFDDKKIFSAEQEHELKLYLKECDKTMGGITSMDFRRVAYEMAKLRGIVMPVTWKLNEIAGRAWFASFKLRHPDVCLRRSNNTMFDKAHVMKYFGKPKQGIGSHSSLRETAITALESKEAIASNEDNKKELQAFYCNTCESFIEGFRYTCVQCAEYDLCSACEAKGAHAQHYILRVPENKSYNEAQSMVLKIRQVLVQEGVVMPQQEIPENCTKIEVKEVLEDVKPKLDLSAVPSDPGHDVMPSHPGPDYKENLMEYCDKETQCGTAILDSRILDAYHEMSRDLNGKTQAQKRKLFYHTHPIIDLDAELELVKHRRRRKMTTKSELSMEQESSENKENYMTPETVKQEDFVQEIVAGQDNHMILESSIEQDFVQENPTEKSFCKILDTFTIKESDMVPESDTILEDFITEDSSNMEIDYALDCFLPENKYMNREKLITLGQCMLESDGASQGSFFSPKSTVEKNPRLAQMLQSPQILLQGHFLKTKMRSSMHSVTRNVHKSDKLFQEAVVVVQRLTKEEIEDATERKPRHLTNEVMIIID